MLTKKQEKEVGDRTYRYVEGIAISSNKLGVFSDFLDKFHHPYISLHIRPKIVPFREDIIFIYIKFSTKRKYLTYLLCFRDLVFSALAEEMEFETSWVIPEED